MALCFCRLCGRVYDPHTVLGDRGLCRQCLRDLDDKYSRVHKYIAGLGEINDITPQGIADETGMQAEDIDLLLEFGFFERDIQTYAGTLSKRQMLAEEFEHELHEMAERSKLNTYGGIIYKRKKSRKENNKR